MADYYPLIAKAVAGLDKSTGEARRFLYERARTALVAQLRGVVPALSESDITRERLALEEAIRKVEAESARKARFEPPARPEPKPAARPADHPSETARSPAPAPAKDVGTGGSGEERSPPPVRPDPPPSSTAAELRRSSRNRVSAERSSLSNEGLKGFRDVVAETENLGEATALAGKTAREAYAAVPPPSPEFERLEPHVEPEGLRPRPRRSTPAREPEAPRRDHGVPNEARGRDVDPTADAGRDRAYGAPADTARTRDVSTPRLPAAAAESHGIDAVQAEDFTGDDFSPYMDRIRSTEPTEPDDERPSQRAERRPSINSAAARSLRPSGQYAKIAVIAALIVVIGGLIAWQRHPIMTIVGNVASLFSSTPAQTPREATPTRQKIPDRVGDARPGQSGAPVAAVAQRVVLYEEDPADPAGKQYVGSAVWRTETVSPGPGQPPEMAVRADIEIPDRKITMKWSLRRNADKTLPASHTIEIMFTLPADFSHGGIQNIPGILMKQAEQTRGVPLAGLAVKVTTNFFLIGLSSVEADMQRNVQLLKERVWFDVPVVYNDGRRAILAVEKGTPGERAFNDAFAAWGQK